MKVLLVDDTHTERLVIGAYLSAQGHTLCIAKNAHEAMLAFEQEKPDLVLLDVVLPDLSGYEIAKRLRTSQDAWVPIIFLSGKDNPEDISQGIQAGGDDYLVKPVNQLVLQAKMKAMQRIADMRHALVSTQQQLKAANAKLLEQSRNDELTGVPNRRYLNLLLDESMARASRTQQPLSVLMCDIDFFKKYNDHYGHIEGDDCLRRVAQLIKAQLHRVDDHVGRFGGEEFAIILTEADLDGAKHVAKKIKAALAQLHLPHHLSPFAYVTLSIGIYTCHPAAGQSANSLLDCADQALYEAKKNGRNRFEIAHSSKLEIL